MNDSAGLRQTVRNCTAVIVATVGYVSWGFSVDAEPAFFILPVVGVGAYFAYPHIEAAIEPAELREEPTRTPDNTENDQ